MMKIQSNQVEHVEVDEHHSVSSKSRQFSRKRIFSFDEDEYSDLPKGWLAQQLDGQLRLRKETVESFLCDFDGLV